MTVQKLEGRRVREHWRKYLRSVQEEKREIIITEDQKPVATLISYEDYLLVRDVIQQRRRERAQLPESWETMLATEDVLARDWDTEEEDRAWADL